ncbi:MAG: response regulator transcription factor [Lachnospiraceae bacterium]|nr:response regulator transcription factor [Lachnospiraceae bacterium]
MGNYRILIAEDDIDIIGVLRLYLENEGYEVLSAPDGEKAYEILQEEKVDLGLFDIMMPKMDGYELIRRVRQFSNIPIIVISAKREDSDRIIGIDIGADDYLTKPFNPLEVVARVRSSLRRYYDLNPSSGQERGDLVYKDLRVNRENMTLYKGKEEIAVTPTELRILMLLMKNPGRVYTKVQIAENLSGEYFFSEENTVMVHISNLRNKIEADPKNPEYLVTVRGLGYKMGK